MSADVLFRIVLELMVMSACGMWTWSLRTDWTSFTRRARRISVGIFILLVSVAYAILVAITSNREITTGTWAMFLAFVVLNAAMLYRPADDRSTERQYLGLLRRLRLHK